MILYPGFDKILFWTKNFVYSHGKPCIRSMRCPVEVIIDMFYSDMTINEIIEDYPELEKENILVA